MNTIHESVELANINRKHGAKDLFSIVYNEFRQEYCIASKTDIKGLDQLVSKEVMTWTYYYIVSKKALKMINKFNWYYKNGNKRKFPKTESVEGEKLVPIAFKESVDAALYIDEHLQAFSKQSGGVTRMLSGKFQIIGY